MRKLLRLISAFTLTASATSPMMACSRPSSESTYNTVAAAIEALNLTSYVMNGTSNTGKVKEAILKDAVNTLGLNNYVTGIKFADDHLIISKVMNDETNEALTNADLVNNTVLALQLTFTYDQEPVEGASSQLNITTKTDQAIVDFINNYNVSKFMSKYFPPVGITTEKFKKVLEKDIIIIFGSFATFIIKASFTINTVTKGNSELKQEDFNQAGKLRVTINYQYQAIGRIGCQRVTF